MQYEAANSMASLSFAELYVLGLPLDSPDYPLGELEKLKIYYDNAMDCLDEQISELDASGQLPTDEEADSIKATLSVLDGIGAQLLNMEMSKDNPSEMTELEEAFNRSAA